MTAREAPPELALYLERWLREWPARDLWHDLARGRLPDVTYRTPDGRAYAGGSWPAWCYLPNVLVEQWMRARDDLGLPAFRALAERHDRPARGDRLGFVPMLAALLCRWRLGKGAYRVHPRMLAALRDTELAPDIPVAALYHLPEWAILIETPGFAFLERPIQGCAAYLNSNFPLRPDPALVLHLFRAGPLEPGEFPAFTRSFSLGEATLSAGFAASQAGMRAGDVERTAWEDVAPFLSVLLYLCSAGRDLEGPDRRPFQPPPPRVQRTPQGLRAHPADRVHLWQVAWRVGAALEAAERRDREPAPPGAAGRTVRPHLRRAHWHTFWAGPREGERAARVKWLPPIPVNVDDPGALPVTVRPVKGSGRT